MILVGGKQKVEQAYVRSLSMDGQPSARNLPTVEWVCRRFVDGEVRAFWLSYLRAEAVRGVGK